MCRTPVFACVVAVVFNLVVFCGKFSVADIAFGCVFIVFGVFGRHFDRFFDFEPIVYVVNLLLNKLFGDVFPLVLLSIVYQLRLVDGVIETLDVVAESAGVVFLVLNGA